MSREGRRDAPVTGSDPIVGLRNDDPKTMRVRQDERRPGGKDSKPNPNA